MGYTLHASSLRTVTDGDTTRWCSPLHVAAPDGSIADQYGLMCTALFDDIQSAAGSGAKVLEAVRRVEAGEVEQIDADGNGWIAHIERDLVWFESLYSQGVGGDVSFAQYKLAVQTYVQFLADPEHQPIEVPFPGS